VTFARTWFEQFAVIAQKGRHFLGTTPTLTEQQDDAGACRRLLRQRGEASSLVLAAEILADLTGGSPAERARFIEALATDFGPDPGAVSAAAERWLTTSDTASLAALSKAVESPRQELFRRLNMVPGGTRALVELRADVLALVRDRPELEPVGADLKHLFASWFNRGFLHLEEITWETSADILERLTGYETVHEMRGWKDLRGRLASDRRCFAFFHPALPREPLIFVEVALTNGLASSVDSLIRVDREVLSPDTADTAVFYSINNAQAGLRGISFGSFLIKQVMAQLTRDFPRLTTYATISPMRQFASVLIPAGEREEFTDERIERLLGSTGAIATRRWLESGESPPAQLAKQLRTLGFAYLTQVKSGIWAADSVAHFHLTNGARIERLNIGADTGAHANESFGLMVNYRYDPAALETNHELYVEHGRVAVAPALQNALTKAHAAWTGT
jgi:malonyl-CoA decarboxylase